MFVLIESLTPLGLARIAGSIMAVINMDHVGGWHDFRRSER